MYTEPTVTEIPFDVRQAERETRELRRRQNIERKRRDRATRIEDRLAASKRLDDLYRDDVSHLLYIEAATR